MDDKRVPKIRKTHQAEGDDSQDAFNEERDSEATNDLGYFINRTRTKSHIICLVNVTGTGQVEEQLGNWNLRVRVPIADEASEDSHQHHLNEWPFFDGRDLAKGLGP